MVRDQIFERHGVATEKNNKIWALEKELEAHLEAVYAEVDSPMFDLNSDGSPQQMCAIDNLAEDMRLAHEKAEKLRKGYEESMANIRNFNTCEFILEVDMPHNRLTFLTVDGKLVQSSEIPHLKVDPVRLCATLGYHGQKVSIVDA